MRFAGKLHSWNDERGFGFIRPSDGGQDIFVHISQLPRDKPTADEVLTFEVALNDQGKKKAVNVRRQSLEAAGLVADAARSTRPLRTHRLSREPRRSGIGFGKSVVTLALIAALGAYAYQRYAPGSAGGVDLQPVRADMSTPSAASSEARFRCDGRQHCSQMTSCAEATFFTRTCPGTKMDGDGDGIPCEEQHCAAWR